LLARIGVVDKVESASRNREMRRIGIGAREDGIQEFEFLFGVPLALRS
jgi:uncharacterized ferredoxin-like protein